MANYLDEEGLEQVLDYIHDTYKNVDSIATSESSNLITSGGVYTAIQALQTQIDEITAQLQG